MKRRRRRKRKRRNQSRKVRRRKQRMTEWLWTVEWKKQLIQQIQQQLQFVGWGWRYAGSRRRQSSSQRCLRRKSGYRDLSLHSPVSQVKICLVWCDRIYLYIYILSVFKNNTEEDTTENDSIDGIVRCLSLVSSSTSFQETNYLSFCSHHHRSRGKRRGWTGETITI